MKILALDMAETTGYAASNGDSGTFSVKVSTHQSKGVRLIKLEKWIDNYYNEYAFDLICYEAISDMRFRNSTVNLAQYSAIVQRWALKNGIEYAEIYQSDIKAAAKKALPVFKKTPKKGKKPDKRVNKEWIVAAARKRFNKIEILDDNHADALFCLEIAKANYHV